MAPTLKRMVYLNLRGMRNHNTSFTASNLSCGSSPRCSHRLKIISEGIGLRLAYKKDLEARKVLLKWQSTNSLSEYQKQQLNGAIRLMPVQRLWGHVIGRTPHSLQNGDTLLNLLYILLIIAANDNILPRGNLAGCCGQIL
jgi:hypothetical protein